MQIRFGILWLLRNILVILAWKVIFNSKHDYHWRVSMNSYPLRLKDLDYPAQGNNIWIVFTVLKLSICIIITAPSQCCHFWCAAVRISTGKLTKWWTLLVNPYESFYQQEYSSIQVQTWALDESLKLQLPCSYWSN